MKRLGRWWRFWVELFSQRESASGLALFRIALGLVILYSLLSIRIAGLVDVFWIDVGHGGYAPLGEGNWLLAWLGGPTPSVVHWVHAVAVLGALAMVVGIGGRWVILLTLQTYNALVTINLNVSGGYDLMITNALWLLFFSDCMATYSLSCRRKTGSFTQNVLISAWPRYLIVFQILVIYTSTGLYKLSADWTPAGGYSALFHVFQDPTWRRFDMDFTASVYPLTQLGTAMVWHWECSAWLMLLVYYFRYTRDRDGRLRRWFNRWDLRLPYAAIGLSMHIGILFTLNVGPFSWIAMSYYILFFRPEEVERVMARLVARLTGRPPTAAGDRDPSSGEDAAGPPGGGSDASAEKPDDSRPAKPRKQRSKAGKTSGQSQKSRKKGARKSGKKRRR